MATRIAVFCGARSGFSPQYAAVTQHVARVLVGRGFGIVYGGGRVGLMGVLADAALTADGEVVGVIPQSLADDEVAHGGLTALHVVSSMHERKAMMADLSDAFVALPGGYGTMDEFHEIVTWAQLGIHGKPIGLLNCDRYYDPLLALYERMRGEGFLNDTNRALIHDAERIDELLDRMFVR